jgi:hypothetical protein
MRPATSPEASVAQCDPLRARTKLPLQARYRPLGFALDLQTNSAGVLQAAAESWPGTARTFMEPPLQLSIGVAGEGCAIETPAPAFRSRGHLLSIMSGVEDFLVCDLRTGSGFGWIRPSTLSDTAFFRYHFLEAAALTLLEQLHFAPVHGATVARSGCGVMLCGESFAGKSTLAYACARDGWTIVSDDASYLLRNRIELFAIGNSNVLRFRPDAPLLFPELSGRSLATRPNGKAGIEVSTSDLPGIHTAPGALVRHVVFLCREEGARAELTHCPSGEAFARLAGASPYGQEDVNAAQVVTYERLSSLPSWRLHYSALNDAVSRLEDLVRAGA